MLGLSKVGVIKKRLVPKAETSTTFVSGSSDYIVVPNHADFQVIDTAPGGGVSPKDFSFSFWFKATVDATSTDNLDGYIGIKAGAFRGHGFYCYYSDDAGDSEKIQVRTNTGSASSALTTTGDTIDHNTWYHIAFTYDVSETTGKIYIDGSLTNTKTDMTAPTVYTGDIHIGSSDTASSFVSSVTSDVAFWKGVALDADQIYSLYEGSSNPDNIESDSLKAWWRLDQTSATGSGKVVDETRNHNGTSSGLADADFDTTDIPTGV